MQKLGKKLGLVLRGVLSGFSWNPATQWTSLGQSAEEKETMPTEGSTVSPTAETTRPSQTGQHCQSTSINAEAWVSPRDTNRAKLGQENHQQAPPNLPTYKIMSQTNGCWWSHWTVGWFVVQQWRTDKQGRKKWQETLLHHCAWGSDPDNQPQRKSCCPYLKPPSQCTLSRNGAETTYRLGEICKWCNLKVLICKGICSPMFIAALFQFSSVTQLCPTLCNPMKRSTPGLPVHHQLPEFTQTHFHWVSDAI